MQKPPPTANRYSHPRLVQGLLMALVVVTALMLLATMTDLFGRSTPAVAIMPMPEEPHAPPAPPSPPEVFMVVEQMPELIGGLEGLVSELRYPPIAQKAGIEGRVIVQFIVDKDGHVRAPRVIRGLGAGLDQEALRVIQHAHFRPGRQRGRAVAVKMSIPITFRLEQDHDPRRARERLERHAATAHQTFSRLQRDGEARMAEMLVSGEGRQMSVDFTRSTPGRLTGILRNPETGQPIAGANVLARKNFQSVGAATDAQGRFELALDWEGPFDLRLSHTQHKTLEMRGLDLHSQVSQLLREFERLGERVSELSRRLEEMRQRLAHQTAEASERQSLRAENNLLRTRRAIETIEADLAATQATQAYFHLRLEAARASTR